MTVAPRSIGWRKRLRSTTALQAAAVALLATTLAPRPAAALPPGTQPSGGTVVAGSASISQSTTTTTINQSSNRAAVNWQSFDVGSQQTVQFNQPNASSSTLNRVVGPNPSEIAGHIQANGQIIVENQAGVVFDKGSQVNAAGLVVTAAGMTNSNFMSGNMVFDQAANPDAKVVNNGTITVKQHGLAALVAPEVRNSGTIRAKMGTVILAGAETDTLDLYGDGLVSINVTGQVTTAPDGTRALVTNTGRISAKGGSVVLTADAVDGVVQTLVDAGGHISANSTAQRTGRVLISGEGGDVRVEGVVIADGAKPGLSGGAIQVSGSTATIVGSHARISASGQAGGGTIALGTTLARAAPNGGTGIGAATTKTLTVKKGAVVSASATTSGNGGRVVLLSSNNTNMAGTINALGAGTAGAGGFVEISGGNLSPLTGQVHLGAASGLVGTLLIDPATLDVIHGTTTTMPDTITDTQVNSMGATMNVVLSASNLLTVNGTAATGGAAVVSLPNHALTLSVGPIGAIDIQPGASLTATNITLSGGSAVIAGALTGTVSVALNAIGNQTETETAQPSPTGSITTPLLSGVSFGTVSLTGSNQVQTLGTFTAANGFALTNTYPTLNVTGTVDGGPSLSISNTGSLTIAGTISAPTGAGLMSLNGTAGITQTGAGTLLATTLTGSAGSGAANFGAAANIVPNLGAFTAAGGITLADITPTLTVTGAVSGGTGVSLTNTGALVINNPVSGTGTVNLVAVGISQSAAGIITAGTLTGSAGTGAAALATATNDVTNLGPFTATTGFTLLDSVPALTVVGAVNGGTTVGLVNTTGSLAIDSGVTGPGAVTLDAATGITQTAAGIITATSLTGSAGSGAADLSAAPNVVPLLGPFTATTGFAFNDVTPTLTVAGAVNGGTGVSLTNTGNLVINNPVSGTGTVTLDANGISQSGAGVVTAGTLTGSAGNGAASLANATNLVTNLGPFTAGAGFALQDNVPALTVVGAVNGGPSVNIANNGGSLAINSGVTASGTVTLNADGITQSAAGVIAANTLTGSAGAGAGDLGAASNVVANLGPFSASTGLTFNDATGALTVVGAVNGGTGVALTNTGSLFISAPVTGTGTVDLVADGISQTAGGVITAGTLTGSAGGGAASLAAAANLVTDLGPFTAATGFTLSDNVPGLTVIGAVNGGTLVSIANTGDLTNNSRVTATNAVTLTAGGDLTQAGQVTAGTDASLTATNGTLTQSGTVTAGDAITLLAGLDLNQGGTLTATGGSATLTAADDLTETGSLTAGTNATLTATSGSLTQSGPLTAGGTVALTAATNLNQNGSVTATGGPATLTAGGSLSQTGSVTAGTSAILLASTGNLTESGTITAPNIQLSAPLGTVTLTGTLAGILPDPTLNPLQALPAGTFPSNLSIGAWLVGSNIVIGPGAVVTGAGGGQLVASLTNPNGAVTFNNFNSPGTALYLNLGTGFASGQIAVHSLQVQYAPPGTSGTINLLGTVNGLGGFSTAGTSFIQPALNPRYQINGCEIGTTNCFALFLQAFLQANQVPTTVALVFGLLPTINPLKDLDVETPVEAEDILIILPDVGERDY
jgi:filamentous hemagglutinin family protein